MEIVNRFSTWLWQLLLTEVQMAFVVTRLLVQVPLTPGMVIIFCGSHLLNKQWWTITLSVTIYLAHWLVLFSGVVL